ncbi:MAG TPA: hypothetical protein VK090_08925 [Paracoccaceae bacterium]|nr:hypothetical protein [Paracoccaceae bacterium]
MNDDARNNVGRYEYFLLTSAVPIRVAYDQNGHKMGADVPDKEARALVKRASYLSVVETSPDIEEITQEEFKRRCARILNA